MKQAVLKMSVFVKNQSDEINRCECGRVREVWEGEGLIVITNINNLRWKGHPSYTSFYIFADYEQMLLSSTKSMTHL